MAEKSMRPLVKKLMEGWTLHIWRMTTPWNFWLESPTGRSQVHLDQLDGRSLRAICREKGRSKEVVPTTPFNRGSYEDGAPMESIYVL